MNRPIRCVAIDDEPLALDVINKFCLRMGGVELETFTNPTLGLEAILRNRPDIVFLDIEMEEASGLDIAQRLPHDTCFIFTTAFMRYALDGFDLDAVDYLHKPFSYSRFQVAFSKALRRLGVKQMQSEAQCIVVKQGYSNINIPTDDILYIEAIEAYSKIHRVSGGAVMSRILLKNILTMLPSDFFFFFFSFVVPKSKIKCYKRQEVVLVGGKCVPVGRQYAVTLLDALTQ